MIPIRDDTPRFSAPVITYFIIILNSCVWLYEWLLLSQSRALGEAFITQFAFVPRRDFAILVGATPLSPSAAILPLFTSMFLHASWLHVIGNMWFLWIFGDNIEDYLGHFKYLIFYLLSGIAATIVQIAFNLRSSIPGIGASGAIAGVMGAYIVLYPRARVLTLVPLIIFFPFIWLPAWIFLGYWFLLNFLSGAATAVVATSQSTGGVAFWAHVGGFVTGIILIKILPARPRRFSYGR